MLTGVPATAWYIRPAAHKRREKMVRAYVLISATAGKSLEVASKLHGQERCV